MNESISSILNHWLNGEQTNRINKQMIAQTKERVIRAIKRKTTEDLEKENTH